MIQFVPSEVRLSDAPSSQSATVWTLENTEGRLTDTTETSSVLLDTTRRELSTSVLRMMVEFERSAVWRSALGHNCAVFALAVFRGNSYAHDDFSDGSGKKIAARITKRGFDTAHVLPRSTVVTSSRPIVAGEIEGAHVLVAASTDGGDLLYASKLGLGPVVLMTLEDSRQLYPHYPNTRYHADSLFIAKHGVPY